MNASTQSGQKKQKKIKKDVIREKVWEEMDDLQQELCKESEDEGEKKGEKRPVQRKLDPSKKIQQIKAYQQALLLHRKNCSTFYNPWTEKNLPLNIHEEMAIRLMEEAKDEQYNVPFALRSIGLKRVKILFKCGAAEHFQSVIQYLKGRKIPDWMKMKHEELLRKKF